ncbi:putative cyclin-dependent serine/threonine-protein kinase DDB_G0272797/DDB_G0274007 [Drosophila grimshawi]|uniref:GH11483 n=1 Tax=Drosophila grimshawi TaxID=7222 RepID=B4JAS1_DROGR|nr:putative cyclin-dependent serine/threonine-protein kinase DDB_G0272797/DDB_G0274007 [Drosophila grimshawi]EDW03879.1 GH11483 [Drosophila grimshawi]
MIIVLLLLFQSLCLYCQRLVLHIHDRCFPRNARLLQEVAETVGDRKAHQHLEHLELEQIKRRQKRRILEPILPLGVGVNLEACRFCAHSPQGYCRHHFHLQLHTNGGAEQDYKQLRRNRRQLKRSLEQQQQQHHHLLPRSTYPLNYSYQSRSTSSLSSGYASLSPSQEEQLEEQLLEEEQLEEEEQQQQSEQLEVQQWEQEEEQLEQQLQPEEQHLITSHL